VHRYKFGNFHRTAGQQLESELRSKSSQALKYSWSTSHQSPIRLSTHQLHKAPPECLRGTSAPPLPQVPQVGELEVLLKVRQPGGDRPPMPRCWLREGRRRLRPGGRHGPHGGPGSGPGSSNGGGHRRRPRDHRCGPRDGVAAVAGAVAVAFRSDGGRHAGDGSAAVGGSLGGEGADALAVAAGG
jgi:hypothetical protein